MAELDFSLYEQPIGDEDTYTPDSWLIAARRHPAAIRPDVDTSTKDFSLLDLNNIDAPVPDDVRRHAEGNYDPDIAEIINAMGQQVFYSAQREYSPTPPPIPIRRRSQ